MYIIGLWYSHNHPENFPFRLRSSVWNITYYHLNETHCILCELAHIAAIVSPPDLFTTYPFATKLFAIYSIPKLNISVRAERWVAARWASRPKVCTKRILFFPLNHKQFKLLECLMNCCILRLIIVMKYILQHYTEAGFSIWTV